MRKWKINRKGQFSIIAALLVAVVLIAAVMTTYSAIRYSTTQDQPQVLSAVDEINLALKQVVGFTVGYYGSVLQVTGNTSYAKLLASNYLQSGLINIGDIRPEWGASFNVTTLNLRTDWFSNASYSSGNLAITYDLAGIGLYNMTYVASSRLDVEIFKSSSSQAFLSITKDESEPLINIGKQNLRFYHYLDSASTWELVTPSVNPVVYANGTYIIDFPAGVDPDSYVIKIEDQRGIVVVASSFSNYKSTLIRNSTYVDADYVDNNVSDVDSSADIGTQSNFTAQQSAPDSIYDTLTEVNVGSGVSPVSLIAESFEGAWYPTGWSVTGSQWSRSNTIKKDGSFSALWDGINPDRSGSMTTFNLDCSDADVIIVDFWYYDAGCEQNEFWLDLYDGIGGDPWTKVYDLGGTSSEDQWLHYQYNYTESQYFRSDFKVRFSASTSNSNDDAYVDLVTVQKIVDGTSYQLDLEEQWTSVNSTDPDQVLCIKAGSLGFENLLVDAWNGGAWVNVASLTGLVNGWKNVSVAPYITSSTFTIRFRGSSDGLDSAQDSWDIDAVLLAPQPDIGFLSVQQGSTIVVEWLQNGTMRWLGQNLELTTGAKPIPPISVKGIHLNQTINGVEQEVPFQVEDWASEYRIPLGLTSNTTVFGNRQMIVFLLDATVSDFTLWWNGSDEAVQTPLAVTPRFTQDDVDNGILSNGDLKLISNSGTYLYVDGFDSSSTSWVESGSSPYLNDNSDYIYDNDNNDREGWFSFQDLPTEFSQLFASADQPIGATVSINFHCTCDSGNDYFEFRINDGTTTYGPYVINPRDDGNYEWRSYDVSGIINTLGKLNNAEIEVTYRQSGGGASNVYIRRARLSLNFWLTSIYGNSTTKADLMRINMENSVYGASPAYVIHHGIVRDILQQEAEWGTGGSGIGGADGCPNLYANIVITLPANASYYTYQLRLMFIDSTQPRTITDICPIRITSTLSSPQVQTENGTSSGFPVVVNGTGAFSNYTSGGWTAHHWSQLISGTRGTGIMFTDNFNQKLYAFDPFATAATGSLNVNTATRTIELSPVTQSLGQVSSFPNSYDITWRGAIAMFDDTTPIYAMQDGTPTGLWLLVEYPPTVTVTAES